MYPVLAVLLKIQQFLLGVGPVLSFCYHHVVMHHPMQLLLLIQLGDKGKRKERQDGLRWSEERESRQKGIIGPFGK